MAKRLFFALTLFAFALVLGACSDNGSKEVIGAWKSVENGLGGKPNTLLINEKSFFADASMDFPREVTFAKKDGKVLILLPSGEFSTKENPWCTITIIDKENILLHSRSWAKGAYVRTTPEELQRIAAMP